MAAFKQLWQQHGDAIALAYAGSAALRKESLSESAATSRGGDGGILSLAYKRWHATRTAWHITHT